MKEVNFFRPWERSFIFMDAYSLVRFIIALIFVVVAIALFFRTFFKSKPMTAKFIARTAVFSAFSIILYTVPFLKFALPIFPAFLEIHLDEIPAFMAGFAYGPLSGFLVVFALATLLSCETGWKVFPGFFFAFSNSSEMVFVFVLFLGMIMNSLFNIISVFD